MVRLASSSNPFIANVLEMKERAVAATDEISLWSAKKTIKKVLAFCQQIR
jgi:hypothetical protein